MIFMKKVTRPKLILMVVLFTMSFKCYSQIDQQASYGSNAGVGEFAVINAMQMYYEIYGSGEPLVLIHGNGQSIADLKYQISYFSRNFKVLVADSRGHGKSELNTNNLNYELMAKDWFSLISHLGIKKAHVFGWSDGGVIGLKLAIHHPEVIAKLAIMGANTLPPEISAYPWAIESVTAVKEHIEKKIAAKDQSENWDASKQVMELLFSDPNISFSQLESIRAPVLVMAGDKDVIVAEHTLSIFHHLKKSHLAIFPGQTHMAPVTDAPIFNATMELFFTSQFKRPDTKDYFK
jgi:pimeloyl-ACP methyl ester carboxylesterase